MPMTLTKNVAFHWWKNFWVYSLQTNESSLFIILVEKYRFSINSYVRDNASYLYSIIYMVNKQYINSLNIWMINDYFILILGMHVLWRVTCCTATFSEHEFIMNKNWIYNVIFLT